MYLIYLNNQSYVKLSCFFYQGAILQDIDELSSVLHLDDTAVLIKSNHSMNDSITATNNIHTWLSSIRVSII